MQKAFLLSLTLISLVLPETKIFQRKIEIESSNFKAISFNESGRKDARNKLLLNNDSSLEENEHEINYSYTYSDKKNASSISTYSTEEPSSTKYSIKYLKSLDLMLIHSYEEWGQEIREDEFYGFPFVDDNGEVDIKFDFNGETATYSSIGIGMPGKGDFDPSYPSQAKIYKLMKITKEITELSEVKGIANKLITVPSLLNDGPLKYLFYKAKLKMIEDDWNRNTIDDLKNPDGMIYEQNDEEYDEWKFGYRINQSNGKIEEGTLRNNGCGIIAMFNLLFDSGGKPYLPSLIALTQALNADLFLGIFGVNPVNEKILDEFASFLHNFYIHIVTPIIQDFVFDTAKVIFDDYLSRCPDWLTTVLHLTLEQIANATIKMICNSILSVISIAGTINLFAEIYLRSLSDISTIINEYTEGQYTAVSCKTYGEFTNTFNMYRQGIISFWNDSNNIMKGAHTIYLRNGGKLTALVRVYNYKECDSKTGNYKSVDVIKMDDFQYKDGYIFGYVWRAVE